MRRTDGRIEWRSLISTCYDQTWNASVSKIQAWILFLVMIAWVVFASFAAAPKLDLFWAIFAAWGAAKAYRMGTKIADPLHGSPPPPVQPLTTPGPPTAPPAPPK